MKSIQKYFLLSFLFFVSCSDSQERNVELINIYNQSFDLMNQEIEKKGLYVERQYADSPKEFEFYKKRWERLDSVYQELKSYDFQDINSQEKAVDFYKSFSNKTDYIVGHYYQYLDSSWTKNYSEFKIESDSLLSASMIKVTEKEIDNSEVPLLFVRNIVASNLHFLRNELFNDIFSTVDCGWSIPWESQGVHSPYGTTISIVSRDFKKKAKNGFFKISEIKNSKGQVISNFESKYSHNIWTIVIPNMNDTSYYISGSIYSERSRDKSLFKADTFTNRKVLITGANNGYKTNASDSVNLKQNATNE